MKKIAYLLCLIAIFLLLSCGVSSSKHEAIQNSLSVALCEAFLAQDDFVVFGPSVELTKVEKGESAWSPSDGYHTVFSYSFEDKDQRVCLHGAAGFNKDGSVIRLPDGKLAVNVFLVMVNNVRVDASVSKYNLPCFSSHHSD